jgi:hypothetical protein
MYAITNTARNEEIDLKAIPNFSPHERVRERGE